MTELKLIVVPDPDEPDGALHYVMGQIDGRPYRFLLDTGAGSSQVVSDDYTSTLAVVDMHHSSGVFARGGHCAFLEDYALRSWVDSAVLAELVEAAG